MDKKNKDLELKINQHSGQSIGQNQELIDEAINFNNNIVKIQSAWRGNQERKKIEKQLQSDIKKRNLKPLNQNELVMQNLQMAAKKIGLTPEMLFRAADKKQKGTILVEEFKQFLMKLKLGLSQAQISRIVYLCDEDCSGIIRKDEYFNCLSTHDIAGEQHNTGTTRTFGQQSLIKYGRFLIDIKLNAEESYRKIDTNFQEEFEFEQLCIFLEKYQPKDSINSLNEKEQVSLFKFLDQERINKVDKETYILKITQAIRIAAQEQGIAISNALKQTGQVSKAMELSKSNQSANKYNSQKLKKQQTKNIGRGSTVNIDTSKIQISSIGPNFINVLNKQNFDYDQFVDNLIQIIGYSYDTPKSVATIKDIQKACQLTPSTNLNKPQSINLFKLLNTDGNGSVDYDEIAAFYRSFRNNKENFDIFYELLQLKLKSRKENLTEKIIELRPDDLKMKEFLSNQTKIIEKDLFNEIAKKLLWIDDNILRNDMYDQIKDEDGNLYISNMEKVLNAQNRKNKEEQVQLQKQKTKFNSDNAKTKLKDIDIDLQEYGNILDKIKQNIDEEDLFDKVKILEDKTQKVESKWKTIFNNQNAALRYAYEQVNLLKKKGLQQWTDPEFGPNEKDQFGSSSLYLDDNNIPSGCPQPEDVKWQRPQEIVKELIEIGEDQYENQQIAFISEGAESNDVKQSEYLGDCYFISALSLVASNDEILIGKYDQERPIDNEQIKNMQSGLWAPIFHYLSQYGIYVIRFFKNYQWRYVFVDDRLPCLSFGKIIFSKCRKATEIWVSIIEKAYAKIHNSYQSLISGDIAQALADMTGMVADKIKLDSNKYVVDKEEVEQQVRQKLKDTLKGENEKKKTQLEIQEVNKQYQQLKLEQRDDVEKLWYQLLECKKNQTLMGCSAEGETEGFIFNKEGESTGILSGHAYSIIDVFTLPYTTEELQKLKQNNEEKNYHGNHRMLRIRNPWGHGEWSLKWSESEGESGKLFKHAENIDQYFEEETQRCAELNIEPPERYDPRSNQNDGTFLMCYKDWRSVFSNLFLCVNFPDDYRGYRFSGQWEEGYNYGVPKASEDSKRDFAIGNHQYIIQVNRNCKTELYISLGQDEGRLYKGEEYPYQRVINSILLCVFKLDSNEQKLQKFDAKKLIASSDKINLRREVDTGQFQVENGTYAVIPCAKNKGDVGHFTLNIYHNQQQKSGIKISQIKDGRLEILDIKNKDYWIMEEEEDVDLFECSKDLVKLMVTEVRI